MLPSSILIKAVFSFLYRVSLVISLVILLAACGGGTPTPDPATPTVDTSSQSSTAESDTVRIGLSISNLANPFFASLQEGAAEAADRLGVTLLVEDAADDAAAQAEQIQSLIDAGVNALLINPVDSESITAAVETANAAGIPVFTIDRSALGGEVVAHIASDNRAGGEMAGDYLADILGESGNVVELKGIEGTSAAQDRGAGFNEALTAYENITIIAAETANFSREEGEAVFAALLEANADIDGVFAHNDEMILGAIEAARAAGRLEEIRFVGFDAVDDALTSLEAGELQATIAQQPAEMGRLGVEVAVAYLNGESVAANIPVDLALITR